MGPLPRPAWRPVLLARSPPPSPLASDLLPIVQMLPDVIFKCVKDERGDIRWTLNEGRLAEEFHVTTEHVYGKTLAEMFPPEVAARQLPFFESAFSGEAVEWTNEMMGRTFKHYPQPVKDADGKVVAVVGFITEVTTLVEAERQARRLNGELLERLVELREANARLAQANRDLDAFAATVSHDLRSPLTVMATIGEILRHRLGDGDPEARIQLTRLARAVGRMDELTAELLAFARTSQKALDAEDIDLSAEAREALSRLEAQGPQRNVEWVVADRLRARGDRALMRSVLENLLGNAWKYTAKAARPRIELRSEGRDAAGRTIYAVADNGIGFAKEDAGRMFHPFERLPGSEGFAGTGLGLATVRRIVERHGGTVWAEGEPGKGCTVRFTLGAPAGPLDASAPPARPPPVAAA